MADFKGIGVWGAPLMDWVWKMFRFGVRATLFALVLSVLSVWAVEAPAQERGKSVYLEVMRSPPTRHVIAMNSMKECREAARYSTARCVYRLPRLPDTSHGVVRSAQWSARAFFNDKPKTLKGGDFGPAYLVIRKNPPNRHVVAMSSMKRCLEAAAYSGAECIEKLPKLPDTSVGVFRSFQ